MVKDKVTVAQIKSVEAMIDKVRKIKRDLDYKKMVDEVNIYGILQEYYHKEVEAGALGDNYLVRAILTKDYYTNAVRKKLAKVESNYSISEVHFRSYLRDEVEIITGMIEEPINNNGVLSEKYIKESLETLENLSLFLLSYYHGKPRTILNQELKADLLAVCKETLIKEREDLETKVDSLISPYGVGDSNEHVKLRESRMKKVINDDIMSIFENGNKDVDCEIITIGTSNGDVLCLRQGETINILSQKGFERINYKTLKSEGTPYKTKGDINSKTDEELLEELFNGNPKDENSVYGKFIFAIAKTANPKGYKTANLSFVNILKGLYLAYNTKKQVKERVIYNKLFDVASARVDKSMKAEEQREADRKTQETLGNARRQI